MKLLLGYMEQKDKPSRLTRPHRGLGKLQPTNNGLDRSWISGLNFSPFICNPDLMCHKEMYREKNVFVHTNTRPKGVN